MTDGMANRGDSAVGLHDFKKWASKGDDIVVSVDVMAFQTSENVSFLDQVRCAGSTEGIYRYGAIRTPQLQHSPQGCPYIAHHKNVRIQVCTVLQVLHAVFRTRRHARGDLLDDWHAQHCNH